MTEPGPIVPDLSERPLKVVPIYFDEVAVTDPVDGESERDDAPPPREPRPKTPLLGGISLGVAVLAAVVQGIAIAVATGGDYVAGTVLGFLAVGTALAAVVGGLIAIVVHRGRRLGVIALVAGVLANPVVLLWLLRLASPASG